MLLELGNSEYSRREAEREERDRYAVKLGDLIRRCRMPLADLAADSTDPSMVLKSAVGSSRASTLRLR
eukprot:2320112-Karenia_brevis.AAC.1